MYAFGYGLTYGKVSYKNAAVAPVEAKAECGPDPSNCGHVTVCVEVTNDKDAAHATEEVVQVYAAPAATIKGASLPKQVLLGFTRTAKLQPGDSETVCVPVDLADLRLMGEGEKSFTLLRGHYTISVGGSSPGPQGTYVQHGGDTDTSGLGGAAALELQLELV